MNPKKQKKVYVTILLFNLYSIWVHVESQIYELNCLKTLKSSEFAKKKKRGRKSLTMFISSCFNNYSIDF